MSSLAEFAKQHPELFMYLIVPLVLLVHFKGIGDRFFLVIVFVEVITTAAIFGVLAFDPQQTPISVVSAALVFYGTTLFILLSEIMKRGFAAYLTKARGEKWTKETDYLYLLIAAVGVIGSLNRIDILTGRFERADIIAPLLLASAIVIRLLKTRAEIGGWNKL
jgi:hypothetical protein